MIIWKDKKQKYVIQFQKAQRNCSPDTPETPQSFSAHTRKPQSLVSLPPELQTWDALDVAKHIKSVTTPAFVKPQN